MKANLRIVPDYEVILCPPAESFRWSTHDYLGLHIRKIVFPKTDYRYGSAISVIVLYLTLVMCWIL